MSFSVLHLGQLATILAQLGREEKEKREARERIIMDWNFKARTVNDSFGHLPFYPTQKALLTVQ